MFITWIAYTLASLVAYGLMRRYRVSSWKGMFVVGAIYGWLIEGAVVATMYGTELPIWATISYTSLAWHALVTVVFGWFYAFQIFSKTYPLKKFFLYMTLLGLLWGVWALNWGIERPAWDTSSDVFLLHSILFITPLPFAYLLVSKLGKGMHALSKQSWIILTLCFGFLYGVQFLLPLFPFSLILPILIALSVFALKRARSVVGGVKYV